MTDEAKLLIRAILTRIRDREGSAGKTKLLKLLYLADIENFRTTRQTITGFDWIFFHFGPWATEYDKVLDELVHENAIEIEKWSASDVEGARIKVKEPIELGKVIKPTTALFRSQRYIDLWADKAIPSLLDYVYFETEPMADAAKGKRLDFTKVRADAPLLYQRRTGTADPKRLRAIREKFAAQRQRLAEQQQKSQAQYKGAPYDEVFAEALATLDSEDA